MSVKYQIFLSSTYDDLRKEREQVIRAILEMGHIPVGMEMFSAADEEQWKLIARQVDQSDYYVVIAAHRYGSVVAGVSYTEKEYDYAVSRGVPVLGFILDDSAPWPADRMEVDPVKRAPLAAFKEKLRQKPVSWWVSAEDLYGKVSIALMKAIGTTPRPGWIRASEVPGPEVTVELSRLSKENASLRGQLREAASRAEADLEARRMRTIEALNRNMIQVKVRKKREATWQRTADWTLMDLFVRLAPELQIERSSEDAARLLAVLASGLHSSELSSAWPIAWNSLNSWMTDLVTLGLVGPSPKRHPVSDKSHYCTLTDEGRSIHQRLRRARLEAGLPDPAAPLEEET